MAKAKKTSSGRWRALVYNYTDDLGKRHYKSFTADTKKEAEILAAQYQLARQEEEEDEKKAADLTYREALVRYIEDRESVLSPATVREYKRSIDSGFDALKNKPLSRITQKDIQRAVNLEARTHSPKTVRNMHGLLTAVLGVYRPDFQVRTDLPKKVRPDLYIPSDEEFKAVLQYTAEHDPQLELAILLAAFGPMRRSEICALRSSDISGNVIHVKRALVMDQDKKWVLKTPKSYAGDRFISYPDQVIEKLSGISGQIITLTPAMITDRFRKALKRAGVQHFRFHDLRHYSASIQHALGVPDAYIMQRGGWGNDAVLKGIYRHALEEQERKQTEKINSYFSNLIN